MYFIMCQVVFAENNKLRYYFLMKQSKLFTKTRKEAPKDEVAKNAQLLIRAGYIHKEMAGAYAILPLGLRVLKKIENIIREEMNMLGGQEIEMTALQGSEVWSKTGRWSDEVIDVWFKPQLKSGADVGLATTHEEPLTAILSEYVNSYRDLPQYVYQFQTKFRNELRERAGQLYALVQ
jgi:prolyl-tRNA synthetase